MIKKLTICVATRLGAIVTKLKYYYRIFCLAVSFYEISRRENAGWTLRQCWSYAKTWIGGDFSTEYIEEEDV